MSDFVKSFSLLLVILNPFALSVYLIDVFKGCSGADVAHILVRASLIGGAIFAIFAYAGEAVFTDVLQVRFAAFQVFGGILFLAVALRFMLNGGSQALISMRGEPARIAGAVAMPFMVGPGSVSAATIAGMRLSPPLAIVAIALALAVTSAILMVLKVLFDAVHSRNAELTQRYVEVASRVSAMVVGSIAVEMIFSGLEAWRPSLPN